VTLVSTSDLCASTQKKILFFQKEAKKITTLKSQIDMYKKQIQELHEQVLNDEMEMKKLEYEHKSLEEINANLKIDKQTLFLHFLLYL
jgi:uncharacterized protein (DUF3084 family)